MRWHEQYLGKPWEHDPDPPRSFNCGELLRHIYKRFFGYDAPFVLADTQDLRSCMKDVRDIRRYADFKEVAIPRDFDVAVLSRGGMPDHVGLFAGGDILHCHPRVGVTLDNPLALRAMGWPNITYLRVEGLSLLPNLVGEASCIR